MIPQSSKHAWLTFAVMVPVLVLAALALLGIRAQTRATWSTAREQAKRAADQIAGDLADDLRVSTATVAHYPNPPVPQVLPPVEDDPLDSRDPAALEKLRDDPHAGLSPAGLPRRVLAALRLMDLAPDRQKPGELAGLVTSVPSVLTTTVLERVGSPELQAWKAGETALSLGRSGWVAARNGTWWVADRGAATDYLTPAAISAALEKRASALPAWAAAELKCGTLTVASSGANATGRLADPLTTVPVSFGDNLRLEVLAANPSLIEADVRRQARWTMSLLAVAVAGAGLALFLMHRALRHERRLGEMKSRFVSSVSHELRAPVGSIRLMAEALHQGKVDGQAAAEFHRLIAGEGARLSQLIENVLDSARIEEGRKRYRFVDTDLRDLVRDSVRVMEPLAAERGVALRVQDAPVSAVVDPDSIRQALVNLLDNALKFSPAGGTVLTRLEGCGSSWTLSVADEGPGIPAAECERVFERFVRLGNELRRETQGTGIGLSIVKHIVTAHGATIRISSNPQGQGTLVTIASQPEAGHSKPDT